MQNTVEQKKAQQQYLLDTGKKLMLQYGIKKTTVDDIVEAAKIAKGTFYLYFKSKEDFFYQLIAEINHNLYKLAQTTIQTNYCGNLKEAIKHYLDTLFNTQEVTFYFREHNEISQLVAKFSTENFTNTETDWIKNLLVMGNIDTEKVKPAVIHNYLHIIFLTKLSDLMIEDVRDETIKNLTTMLLEYIFSGAK